MADAIHCPKCKSTVEGVPAFCPHCGYKMVGKSKKRKVTLFLVCLLTVVTLAICTVFFSNLTVVPSVVGSAKEDAVTTLDEKGFQVEFVSELTDNIEENIVYKQSFSGLRLPNDNAESITLYVSEGIATECPVVEGMTEQQALQALDAADLKYSITRQYTTELEEGVVFKQDKKGQIKSGSVVTIFVSQGIGKVVSDQSGKSPQQAIEELSADGFNVIVQEYTDGADIFADSPIVVGQDKIGIQPLGETVTLEVNRPSLQISTISISTNSINGVDVEITLKNVSEKEIKYVDLEVSFYNPFGEPAYCEISGENTYSARYVGPLYPNSSKQIVSTRPVIYNPNVAAWRLTSIVVTFTDNTTQTLTASQFWHTNDYVGDGTFY